MSDNMLCPCGSGKKMNTCCGIFIEGHELAKTAHELMRSRYTANVLKNIPYLLATWHPDTRPDHINENAIPKWSKLQIIDVEKGMDQDVEGTVEFEATAFSMEKVHTLRENSRFVKEEGAWFYRDGEIKEARSENISKEANINLKIGRNDPCYCGSGKKFKKCCR